MKRPIVPWVTVGPEPYLATCQRCKATINKMPRSVPLEAFVAYLHDAQLAHQGCQAQAEGKA